MSEGERAFSCLMIGFIGLFIGGFCLMTVWNWFMPPIGVAAIGFWHAIGLSVLVQMLLGARGIRADYAASKNFEHEKLGLSIVINLLWPVWLLMFGLIAKAAM